MSPTTAISAPKPETFTAAIPVPAEFSRDRIFKRPARDPPPDQKATDEHIRAAADCARIYAFRSAHPQDIVSFIEQLHLFFAAAAIRMPFSCFTAKRAVDLSGARPPVDAQHLVIIFG